jgi:hypothetical protein
MQKLSFTCKVMVLALGCMLGSNFIAEAQQKKLFQRQKALILKLQVPPRFMIGP